MAHRMLGNTADAEDAVQEAWLRFDGADTTEIQNVPGWLSTVTARVCLNMLRTRAGRREQPLDPHVPDLVVTPATTDDPAAQAIRADSLSLALLVVLNTLSPDERVAFVLHDVFGVPFEEIAPLLDRTPQSARKLASRARIRVRTATATDPDRSRQRAAVDAFFAAARTGNLERLVAVLHPDAVLRADGGATRAATTALIRGAESIARRATLFARNDAVLVPVLVNGVTGVVIVLAGVPVSVMAFTVVQDRISTIDVLTDPDRITGLHPVTSSAHSRRPPEPRGSRDRSRH